VTRVLPCLILLTVACTVSEQPPPREAPAGAGSREAILAADQAFADSTDRRGLDGWMAWMTDDAVRLEMGGRVAVGRQAVRAFDAPLFADSTVVLRWTPTDAGAFADGSHGWSTGRGALVRRTAPDTLWQGGYVTFWRRDSAGAWRVILDTGS
jgi:ketosteroid isomerase-like protein